GDDDGAARQLHRSVGEEHVRAGSCNRSARGDAHNSRRGRSRWFVQMGVRVLPVEGVVTKTEVAHVGVSIGRDHHVVGVAATVSTDVCVFCQLAIGTAPPADVLIHGDDEHVTVAEEAQAAGTTGDVAQYLFPTWSGPAVESAGCHVHEIEGPLVPTE